VMPDERSVGRRLERHGSRWGRRIHDRGRRRRRGCVRRGRRWRWRRRNVPRRRRGRGRGIGIGQSQGCRSGRTRAAHEGVARSQPEQSGADEQRKPHPANRAPLLPDRRLVPRDSQLHPFHPLWAASLDSSRNFSRSKCDFSSRARR
jgi:hypothetical protein